jgi:thiamine kinase-like enzyme
VVAINDQSWAFATEFIVGRPITAADLATHAASVIKLLTRLHSRPAAEWMGIYNPVHALWPYLDEAKRQGTMPLEDLELVDAVIVGTAAAVASQSAGLVPCHNDFHGQNILVDESGQLWAIDFENCDLGDPMWDLAYLTLNLGLQPLGLARQYGCTAGEGERLQGHYFVAIAHRAVWSAVHGLLWVKHYQELMAQLRKGWTVRNARGQ